MGTDSGIHPIQAVCLASSEAQNPAFVGDIIRYAQTSAYRSLINTSYFTISLRDSDAVLRVV